jgi:hypothetical protein
VTGGSSTGVAFELAQSQVLVPKFGCGAEAGTAFTCWLVVRLKT